MKKRLFLPLFAMALMLTGCMVASCSNDDNNDSGKKNDEEQKKENEDTKVEVTAKSTIYMADTVFNMVDLSFTYDGKTVVLTKENTKDTIVSNEYGTFHVRKYVMYTKTTTEFPTTYKFITKRHVKDGVDMKKAPKFDNYFAVETEFANKPVKLWTIDSDEEILCDLDVNFGENDTPENPADEIIDLKFNVEQETTVTITDGNHASVKVKKI